MEKEFIPYEQALALKELGFDEPCFGLYENRVFIFKIDSQQEKELLLNCTAPTYSQAFRWFRGRGINNYIVSKNYRHTYHIFYHHIANIEIGCFKSYEEAEQDCLEELIKTEILLNKISNNRGKH